MAEMGYLDRRGGHGPEAMWYGHPSDRGDCVDQDDRVAPDHAEAGRREIGDSARVFWCQFCETAVLSDQRPEACPDCGVEGSGLDDLGEPHAGVPSGSTRVTVCDECGEMWDGLTTFCDECGSERIRQETPRPVDD